MQGDVTHHILVSTLRNRSPCGLLYSYQNLLLLRCYEVLNFHEYIADIIAKSIVHLLVALKLNPISSLINPLNASALKLHPPTLLTVEAAAVATPQYHFRLWRWDGFGGCWCWRTGTMSIGACLDISATPMEIVVVAYSASGYRSFL